MYNKKVLIDSIKKLGSATSPPKKKDMIIDPRGQWAHPGQNTRIPSNNITMDAVPYPVYGDPNVGPSRMMYPEQEYNFPGADYVDEYPQINSKKLIKKQLGGLTRFVGSAGRMMGLPPALSHISNIAPKVNALSNNTVHLYTKIVPRFDQETRDLLRYPSFDVLTGETEIGSPTELTKYLGDFDFKAFSDGWEARNQMMNAFDEAQWVPSKDDFFTNAEIQKLIQQQNNWQKSWQDFQDMYPENPAMSIFNAFIGDTSRNELFSNLFPNASLPNFRSKILKPEQEAWLQKNYAWGDNLSGKGKLKPVALKKINTGFETLPKTYQDLLEHSNKNDWFATGPARDVVMEMRGSLGLKLDDVKNATPEQFEKWRQEIVKKKNIQVRDEFNRDISNPFKGSDAWREISNQSGYKNQYGGALPKFQDAGAVKLLSKGYDLLSKVTRSNYNPLVIPIKKIGYTIASQSAGFDRSKQDILNALKGKSKSAYFGTILGLNEKGISTYGPGKRDLNKLYFFGDETGFLPVNYDFSSDPGLDKLVEKYGPLKAFLLNSKVGHGEPISAFQLNTADILAGIGGGKGFYEPLLNFKIPMIQGWGPEATPQFYLPDGSLNLDLLSKGDIRHADPKKIMETINHPELQTHVGYLKDFARARFNTLFDEVGTDVIPFQINAAATARPEFMLESNPVRPLDNVAGHMGFAKRLPNKEFEFTTRDIWGFTPSYDEKWSMNTAFQKAQRKAMEMFGKPFVLTQTNPIKFRKGGDSTNNDLSVKQSNIQGKGLFINKPIKKGETIGLAHVNGQATPMVGKYHNHSEDNPTAINVPKDNKRYLVASRDLPAGTEITTNYRLQPELEQPENFMQKGGMTPQKDGYRTYSPFKNLPYIDVETDTIDTDNIVYDLQLMGDNGVTKNVQKNTGLHKIPGANVIREIPMGRKGGSISQAKYGGLHKFVGGGASGCPKGEYWNGTKCVKIPKNTRIVYHTDKDVYDKAFAAESDSSHFYNNAKSDFNKFDKLGDRFSTPMSDEEWQKVSDQYYKLLDSQSKKWHTDEYRRDVYIPGYTVNYKYKGPKSGLTIKPVGLEGFYREGYNFPRFKKPVIHNVYEEPIEEEFIPMPIKKPELIDTTTGDIIGQSEQLLAPEYSANYPKNRIGYDDYNWYTTKSGLPKRQPNTGGFYKKTSKKVQDIKNYMEGYEDEDGNYIPGEIENAEREGRQLNFQGNFSKADKEAQENYNKEYDEYENLKNYQNGMMNLMQYNLNKKQYGGLNKFVEGDKPDNGIITQEEIDAANTAMMKARLAYANEFGNPAAKRMINLPDEPYQFDNGDMGTHYMASMDNYAVPQIQDENGQLMLGDYGPDSREAMRFDSDEDANYFAENYKDVSPGFMELELSPEEIEEYAKGGYIVEDISVPSLNRKQLGGLIKSGKNLLRGANIATLGTANTLAKNLAPVMINPARIPMFGAQIDKVGPFTGSPLNVLPGYGKKMESTPGTAFRKFGDTLDYVKMSGELNPAHGPLLRMGKDQVMSEGNWAELNEPNEQYSGVFGAQFDTRVPGSDLSFKTIPKRNGVLVTDASGNLKPIIPISDPGLSFHRRLPFSNRYIPVDMNKLRNDQFDWRTVGGNAQSLLERYGYAAGYAGLLGAMGLATPQEYIDQYINEPIMKGYNKYIKPGVENMQDVIRPKRYGLKEDGSYEEYSKGGWIVEELDNYAEGGQPCPDGYTWDETKQDCVSLIDTNWLSNWYANRKLPLDEIPNKKYVNLMKERLPQYNPESTLLEELANLPPVEYQDVIDDDPNNQGQLTYDKKYNPDKILLKKSLLDDPVKLNQIYNSEASTAVDVNKPGLFAAQNMVIDPGLVLFEDRWGDLKGTDRDDAEDHYNYITDPEQDNIHSLVFEERYKRNLKSDQVITEADINKWKSEAEANGALDRNSPNFDDGLYTLFKLAKDNKSLMNWFNQLASNDKTKTGNKTKTVDEPQYAKQGGAMGYELGEEIDEATMKKLKKLGYTFETI
jgi:hypothetical protein